MAIADGPLGPARRQLQDAVAALIDPIPVHTADGYRWQPALYADLRSGLTGQSARRRALQQRSRAPLRIEVLALLVEIDDTAARWDPDGKDTTERLRAVAARAWRPQDVGLLERYRDELLRWTQAATELLTPTPRVFLPMPCPRCSAAVAYHRSGTGERVRTRALQVSETGCQCLACGAFWEPERFEWLARLLECPKEATEVFGRRPAAGGSEGGPPLLANPPTRDRLELASCLTPGC